MRILRRDDEERVGQRIRREIRAHLALLHRLQQRALRAWTCAVDFIGEQELREDRALAKFEDLARALKHGYADDVGRQQVARELHALPCESQHVREGVRKSGLADAGHVLDEEVAAREKTGETQAHLSALAEDHGLERGNCALQCRSVRLGHALCRARTRVSCASSPLAVRSSSAARSRRAPTTAAGA